ncbi:ribosome maturation factor RimP [Orrella marina]|uniref:Ribosome maturation factor RimP n=1 Tax=Orrella marina TaxID=2163011 RepID=A0A2R4XFK8_9BURK|nr:ribosome maturation factor RimP [Orrella marina]AWB32588.1 ribosome maturation factor RimP [Orrella marina]
MVDLFQLTRDALAMFDLELVDVERAPMGLLRVTIDHPDGVRIEHCEQASKQLSRVYEVENIDYRRLEVGSPGVDRPLRTLSDFRRFTGERVEIRVREPVDGQKVFVGQLVETSERAGTDDSGQPARSPQGDARFSVEFEAKKGVVRQVSFSLDEVERAKLSPLLDFKGKKR